MAGRPGFFRNTRESGEPDRDGEAMSGPGIVTGDTSFFRLGEPDAPLPPGGLGAPAGFDPIWGTLGAPSDQGGGSWRSGPQQEDDGVAVEVDIFGDGFHIAGQIRTGRFDRLSDWINMQTGFIRVWNASQVHGGDRARDPNERAGELWVRLGQIVMVAARTIVQQNRPGAPVVQKQWQKVSINTPGYNLRGNLHVHADGSMKQFLEAPDPHFLPITDVAVRGLSRPALVTRFPFAMVNREQLVSVLAEAEAPALEAEPTEVRSA
jgi:hypothetical protein